MDDDGHRGRGEEADAGGDEVGTGPAQVPSAHVIGAAAAIAPSWPSVPLSAVTNGTRRPLNQLATSRSRQIQVIASPTPTNSRATSAAP